jgi:hypothetical protein
VSTYPFGKFLHVSFVWKGAAKTKELEPIFNNAGDWLRHSANGWIVWTTLSAQEWYNRLALQITKDDRMFICELNTANMQGWMDKWEWDWIQKSRVPPLTGR